MRILHLDSKEASAFAGKGEGWTGINAILSWLARERREPHLPEPGWLQQEQGSQFASGEQSEEREWSGSGCFCGPAPPYRHSPDQEFGWWQMQESPSLDSSGNRRR